MFNAPLKSQLLDGLDLSQVWALFFNNVADYLNGRKPVQLLTVSVVSMPSASENTGAMVFVQDETGGAVVAFSDGSNWRRMTDRNIVS